MKQKIKIVIFLKITHKNRIIKKNQNNKKNN